jgi:hypothetical protein
MEEIPDALTLFAPNPVSALGHSACGGLGFGHSRIIRE